MDLQLKGRVGVVLAGSQGLGKAIGSAWAAEGASVALLARTQATLDQAIAEIANAGGEAIGIATDIYDPDKLGAAIDEAGRRLGPVELLLLNTGGPPPTGPTVTAIDAWQDHFDKLLVPMVRAVDRALPGMRERGFGRIMYIAAPGILTPASFTTLSQSMRVAVASWLKTLASEVARDGITVNTIIPGVIDTERVQSLSLSRAAADGISAEAHTAKLLAEVPIARMGTPEEFAAIAAFLASPLAAYMTGSTLRVDGGWIRPI